MTPKYTIDLEPDTEITVTISERTRSRIAMLALHEDIEMAEVIETAVAMLWLDHPRHDYLSEAIEEDEIAV